jgi:FkbM family methyltransferase
MKSIFRLYRSTFKKVPGFHHLVYAVGENLVLPFLEAWQNFRTPSTDPLNFRLQLLLNQWEPETVAFFKRVVRPGDRVLDIGAHVGYYTRLFARLVGPAGKVVAVEPHPENFRLLEENTKDFSQVFRFNVAAGDKEDELQLCDGYDSTGGSSLLFSESRRNMIFTKNKGEIAKRISSNFRVRNYKVKMVPLDKILSAEFRIAKIDIEGAECIAIKGMTNIMNGLEIIVCELAEENLKIFGFTSADLIHLVQRAGLKHFYVLENKGYKEVEVNELVHLGKSLKDNAYINIAASRYPL